MDNIHNMNSKNEISDNVKRVLKNIEEKDYSKKELQNTFNNITANKEITDYEKEVLNFSPNFKFNLIDK